MKINLVWVVLVMFKGGRKYFLIGIYIIGLFL